MRHHYHDAGYLKFCPCCMTTAVRTKRLGLIGIDINGFPKEQIDTEVCRMDKGLATKHAALEFTDELRAKWREAYPNARLGEEAPKMQVWLDDHPKRQPKTPLGLRRFVATWLGKASKQQRGRYQPVQPNLRSEYEVSSPETIERGIQEMMRARGISRQEAEVLAHRLHSQ